MDLLAYRPLRNSPRLIPLITAIGLSLFLQNAAQATWGAASRFFPADATPQVFSGRRLPLFTPGDGTVIDLSLLDGIIIALAILLMVGLQLFILRTRTGKAMRACAQDRTTASLMGIKVNTVVALAFALGAGLAAMVAPLYVLRGSPIYPQMGYIVGILAFASAVLGGIGNITGAMLGGLIIGIIYSFVPLFDAFDTFRMFGFLERAGWITREGYSQFVNAFGRPGQYQLGVAYAFMILVIVFKPTGLLGQASAKRA
jgi:branched-chain amino acid transport system permease protein